MLPIANEVRQCLLTNILPYWKRLRDYEHGGFFGQVTGDEQVQTTAVRGAILYARLLWTFSACRCLDEAREVKEYIFAHFLDPVYGGSYWSVDYLGHPLDTKKHFYAQAFMIYGLSEYARVNKDSDCLEAAVNLYHLLEKHARDTQDGGYFEAATQQWQPLHDVRLSEKDENTAKSQNTHLHILEAYCNLYRIWPQAELKASIEQLITVFIDHILQPSGHLGLFFDNAWHVTNQHFSYGHDLECSWLLDEAAQLVHLPVDDAVKALSNFPFPLSEAMYKDWWESAEAMVGYYNRYLRFSDQAALVQMTHAWDFIKTHLLDTEHGEWFWSGRHNPQQDKAGFWKCPYHNARMCLKLSGLERTPIA